jgi:hypothetical protein
MIDVHDHGMRGGPTFQLKNLAYGFWIVCIRAQAIDRLGRERDQIASAQRLDCVQNLLL